MSTVSFIILKVLVSTWLAWALTRFAERKSIFWSGILATLPNVSLLNLLFISLEQGPEFGSRASVSGIYGFIANASWAVATIFVLRWTHKPVFVFLGALTAHAGTCFLVYWGLPENALVALGSVFVYWLVILYSIKNIPLRPIQNHIPSGFRHFLFQWSVITTSLLTVTWLAPMVGTRISGFIGTFSSMTFSVALLILVKHGPIYFKSFVRSALVGWMATAVYFYSFHLSVSAFGVWAGLAISLFVYALGAGSIGLLRHRYKWSWVN